MPLVEAEAVAALRAAACCPLADVAEFLRGAPWTQVAGVVDVLDCVSASQFFVNYLLPGRPALIRGLATDWRATSEWVDVSDGSPALDALAARFGSSPVDVADCQLGEEAPRLTGWTVGRFCDYLRSREADERSLYLKDWHCRAECEAANEAPFYVTPLLVADDWLNGYYDAKGRSGSATTADYRFVYLGPQGSCTPLHADVLRSFSWSTNVCGVKRWELYPPGCEPGGIAPAAPLLLTQAAGETVFVPSGWHHTVANVGTCAVLSINHNWTNAAGVDAVWSFLRAELAAATAAIDDVAPLVSAHEFDGLLARNVRANAGLDLAQFATQQSQ